MVGFPDDGTVEERRLYNKILKTIDKIEDLEHKLSLYSRRYYALRTGTPVDSKVPSRIILSMLDMYKKSVVDNEEEDNENDGSKDI